MRGVLAHDEVRQWAAVPLDISDEAERHTGARLGLDANHFCFQMKGLFAGQIEVELGRCTGLELTRRSHEEPVA